MILSQTKAIKLDLAGCDRAYDNYNKNHLADWQVQCVPPPFITDPCEACANAWYKIEARKDARKRLTKIKAAIKRIGSHE
jgi:hypothetical protein